MHTAREEAQGVQAAAAGFVVGATRLTIAELGAQQDGTDSFQATPSLVSVKRQRGDQRVGGVANLAQRDCPVFPPGASPSGELRTND
jgi:hypothetical protein